MRFSVITTTFNDIENLKITCGSVRGQDFADYEYLVIDGGSTDGTVEYLASIAQEDRHVRYVSESDHGIYDAMNKGVSIAKGDYIVFLGAADSFYSQNTLKEVDELIISKVDVLYGRCVYSSGKKADQKLGYKLRFLNILFDKYVAHQSVYAKRELLLKYPFDLRYAAQADQDFMFRMEKLGYNLKYVNVILAYYDGMGFSSNSNRYGEFLKERIQMLKIYHPIIYKIRSCGHWVLTHEKYSVED